jgi:Amidohydrolase
MRKNVFIDTTLFHPALIRALVDLLGPDNVMAGSDWPIAGDRPVRDILLDTMQMAGLSNAEQAAIAGSSAGRLLLSKLSDRRFYDLRFHYVVLAIYHYRQ